MNPIWQRILNLFAPGVVSAIDDGGRVQRAQMKIGFMERRDGTPVMQQFGFASVPPAGSDLVVAFFAGDRSNGVVVASNHGATRPTGQAAGETTVFNAHGMTIALTATGIDINGGGQNMTISNTPTLSYTGKLAVTGSIIVNGTTLTVA